MKYDFHFDKSTRNKIISDWKTLAGPSLLNKPNHNSAGNYITKKELTDNLTMIEEDKKIQKETGIQQKRQIQIQQKRQILN